MCLLFIAWQCHPKYSYVVAANRDEFHKRPTGQADFWPDHPEILGGVDIQGGGTWLGVTRNGDFAALTNYREPGGAEPGRPSRGDLVKEYLIGHNQPESYLTALAERADAYNGFNLMCGNAKEMWIYSNRDPSGVKQLTPGVYGLSNHLLNTPWPKLRRGKSTFGEVLANSTVSLDALLDTLADTQLAEDNELPDTGLGPDWEKMLSAMFIISPDYGTRSSAAITLDYEYQLRFRERTYNRQGEIWATQSEVFRLAE